MIYGLVLLVPPKPLDGVGHLTPVSLFPPFQASAQLTQSEKLIRFAAMENNEKVMLHLDNNSDIINEMSALIFASRNGHKEIAQILFENNLQIALIIAAKNGQKEIVEILLKNNANIYAQDVKGRTSLFYAVHNGHKEIVQLLLDKNNTNINVQDYRYNYRKALELAVNC